VYEWVKRGTKIVAETIEQLKHQFPSLNLKDNVPFNDRPQRTRESPLWKDKHIES
jgi:hypothetical protein